MDNWQKQFEKEVIDYCLGKKNIIGTQRLSINHINKIEEFISSLLQQKDQEWRDKIEKWANKNISDGDPVSDFDDGVNAGMRYIINFIK